MPWSIEDAKDMFDNLLDTAEAEGPQIIWRGRQCFVVVTEQEAERRFAEGPDRPCGKFLSLWDVLRFPPHHRTDEELFPRVKSEPRPVDFD